MPMLEEIVGSHAAEVREIISGADNYSVFEDYDEFKVLVLRRFQFDAKSLGFQTEAFVLKEKSVYYLSTAPDQFTQLAKGYAELQSQLEGYYRLNQRIIGAYLGEIEKLEDLLFDRKIPNVFMDTWFDLKKDIAKLENHYYRNEVVYREFLKKCEPLFGRTKDDFKDIEDTVHFHVLNLQSLKSRLDGVHHYYDSIKNDGLNKTLLALTIISGVFLPLNLIVGFFGMNTPGLFFAEDLHGTRKVLMILAGVVVFCLMGFQIIKVIDRYILRFILGRYDFYKSITERLDEIRARLRVK